MTSRPPLPPFTQETAVLKVRLAEDGWNTRDPEKVHLPTRWIHVGGTAPNSQLIENRSSHSSGGSGRESWITGSSRSCGHSTAIASRYDSPTNTTTTQTLVSRLRQRELGVQQQGLMYARHASINEYPSRKPIGSSIGPWDGGLTTIRV